MKKFMMLHYGFENPTPEIMEAWGMDSITGYNIIEAENLDEAERIAVDNPFIASIRVYEIRSM